MKVTGDRGRLVGHGPTRAEQIREDPGVLVRQAGSARAQGNVEPSDPAQSRSPEGDVPTRSKRWERVKRTLYVGRFRGEDRGSETTGLVVAAVLFEPDLGPGFQLPRRHHTGDGVGLGVFSEA